MGVEKEHVEPVTSSAVDPAWIAEMSPYLDNVGDATLTVLPTRVEGGRSVYPDLYLTMVKDLRSAGVAAAYLKAPGGKVFQSEFSAVVDLVGAFLFSMGSNAGWDACKATFSYLRLRMNDRLRSADGTATLRVGTQAHADGSITSWVELTGPTAGVLDKAESLILAQLNALQAADRRDETKTVKGLNEG